MKALRLPEGFKPTLETASLAAAALVLALALATHFFLDGKLRAAERLIAARKQEVGLAKASGLNQLSPQELAKLQKRVVTFKRGFVTASQSAAILDGISDQAEKSAVRVVSVHSEAPVPIRGEDGAELRLDGIRYGRLAVKMRLEGSTKALADFLRSLADSSDRLFVVDSLSAWKAPGSPDVVTCDLSVSFFTSGA